MQLNIFGNRINSSQPTEHSKAVISAPISHIDDLYTSLEYYKDTQWIFTFTIYNKSTHIPITEKFLISFTEDRYAIMGSHIARMHIMNALDTDSKEGCYLNMFELEEQVPEMKETLDHVERAKEMKKQGEINGKEES